MTDDICFRIMAEFSEDKMVKAWHNIVTNLDPGILENDNVSGT